MAFSESGKQRRHMRIHTKEKPPESQGSDGSGDHLDIVRRSRELSELRESLTRNLGSEGSGNHMEVHGALRAEAGIVGFQRLCVR